MCRGNIDLVVRDGAKIVKSLRKQETSLAQLMTEYHCAYGTIIKVVRTYIPLTEWKMIRRKILAKSGIKTRFQKGMSPWNKGLHYDVGGRSVETRFKPGQIRGSAARRYKPVGSVTIRKDSLPRQKRNRKRKDGLPPWPRNYRRYIKIKDTGRPQYCWIPYACYLWQQANGPVPQGCFIVHVDGNTLNDNLDNLRCVDRKGHLALQYARDPKMRQKRNAHSARTRRKNRRHKITAHKTVTQRNAFWQCIGCGQDYYQDKPPFQCSKCTGGSFERIIQKISA